MLINSGSTPRSNKKQSRESYLDQAKKLLKNETSYTDAQMPPLMVKDFDRELCELLMDYPDPSYMDIRRAVSYTCQFDSDNLPIIIEKLVNNKEIFTLEAWNQIFTFAVPQSSLPEYMDATSNAIANNKNVTVDELHWLLRFALLEIFDPTYESIGRDALLHYYITIFNHPNFKIDIIFEDLFYTDRFIAIDFIDRQEGIFIEAMQKSKKSGELLGFVFEATENIKCLPAEAVSIFCF